ncbi:class F sortase [Arthrobacter sp. GCM10027362]|uniref:class F sortase n=1 Tax=Arthrobacter sp. GCM10027362 TaxID=3273379 RepID=UPI00366F87DC
MQSSDGTPQPPAEGLRTGPVRAAGRAAEAGSPTAGGQKVPAVLAASRPVALTIGKIGLNSPIMRLGQRSDLSLEVPPGDAGAPAGWYVNSPTPGARGPSVMLGHVNSIEGAPGVFARLRELAPGDAVRVEREDGSSAVFEVFAVEKYAKDAFPALRVYGNTNRAELRLITCDGYDPQTGKFDDNLVVYAALTARS